MQLCLVAAIVLTDRIARFAAVKSPRARILKMAPLAAIVRRAPWLPGAAKVAPC